MCLLVEFTLSVDNSQTGALLDFLDSILDDTRRYDGCSGVEVFTSMADHQMILQERWNDKEAFDKYMSWRVDKGDFQLLQTFLTAPPEISFLTQKNRLMAAVREASLRWRAAFNSKNPKGCVQQYATDAVMQVTPFGSYEGHDAIEAFWTQLVAQGYRNVEYIDPKYEIIDETTVKLSSHWKMNKAQGYISEELWRLDEQGRAYLIYDAFEVAED
ncbi:antibiotic biosynthesis monooxygenase [Marinicella sp. W31]|uniref:antibiotic biosynthesis monooxygenase n=1 Tax=Marinicella sp. W31 TaxID=3023713 RepID=UPI0037566BE0